MIDEVQLLPSASRVATAQSNQVDNLCGRGIALYLDVTDVSGGGQVDSIQIQVPVGPGWVTVYQFTTLAIATVSQKAFAIYPGAASAGSWAAAPIQGPLPRRYRAQVTHHDANAIVYDLRAEHLP